MKAFQSGFHFGCVTLLLCFSFVGTASADIQKKLFGITADGQAIDQYILTNKSGSSLSCITYGAIITNLLVPDKQQKLGDIVLGYDTLKEYEDSVPSMCCVVGRYANRIAGGTFILDDTQYFTTLNQGGNTLHGGFRGLGKRVWKAEAGVTPDGPTVRFTILDPDGAEGFPGNLNLSVLYTLTNINTLRIQYYATTDKATPINLAQHCYFNLSGTGKPDVLSYITKFYGYHYLPLNATLIPTGEIAPVANTPFDFTKAKPLGQDIKALPGTPPGYDNPIVLDNQSGAGAKAVEVYDPASGRKLECSTTEPLVHFSSGANLGGVKGKGGEMYTPYRAFCLETQHFPDSPNHSNFPSTILRPGKMYRQLTEFRFTTPAEPMTAEK